MPECPGSGNEDTFSVGQTVTTNGSGEASSVRRTCPTCRRSLVCRVIKTSYGCALPRPVGRIPRHKEILDTPSQIG